MGSDVYGLVGLVAIFAIAAMAPVNMGILGFAGAFLVGGVLFHMAPKDILAGFPADLFLTLVGITYLFGIAQRNGSIDRVLNGATRLTGAKPAVVPWLVFAAAALLTGFGALGPAAVAIIAPLALQLARRFSLPPLLLGLMTIHGAQAGAFSPISVYGVITHKAAIAAGLIADPLAIFWASLAINAAIALVIYLVLSPRRKAAADSVEGEETPEPLTWEQGVTLLSVAAFALCATVLQMNVGFMAVFLIAGLALLAPKSQKDAIAGVSWSTVLLICGVITYVSVLEKIGAIDWIGAGVAAISVPLVAALLLSYFAGITSAFASSTALLGVVIPLAAPLSVSGGLGAVGLVSALCVATTIVDTSPFSTNGALIVASAEPDQRERVLRRLLIYTAGIVALGPLFAWAILVAPTAG
ncbi:SLC13 family permease [Phenylobacterium sp.]|jgi:di/tricarboxylate transporter|uniref:SLC13 family permease n=1 Tax=Phenylobacterium sp. TaxID=1871053 RepID=UPI003783AF22